MKLIFTSYGFNSLIVSQKLHGLVDAAEKSVIVLPFAGFHEGHTYQREKQGLMQFGFAENQITLCDKSNIQQLHRVDYIYVPGGDTFKLLHYIRTNKMIEPIRHLVQKGAVYIGVSAGAALASADLAYVSIVEDDNFSFTDYRGLGLCRDILLPHSDQVAYAVVEKTKQQSDKNRGLLFIKNSDVVLMEGETDGDMVVDYL